VITQAAKDTGDSLFVIGWSWIERFDYLQVDPDPNWRDRWDTIGPHSDSAESDFYYRNLHSELRDKITSLMYIKSAIDCLQQKNIPFVMTYMDDLVLDKTWNATTSVRYLQDYIGPHLQTFENKTFLEYAKMHGFPISATLHPLAPAHTAGAKVIWPAVQNCLKNHNFV
jgi:hypothetical protein